MACGPLRGGGPRRASAGRKALRDEQPVRPVSYTHLDVYKRQRLLVGVLGSPALHERGDHVVPGAAGGVLGHGSHDRRAPGIHVGGVVAVSYTHLDVYKRQLQLLALGSLPCAVALCFRTHGLGPCLRGCVTTLGASLIPVSYTHLVKRMEAKPPFHKHDGNSIAHFASPAPLVFEGPFMVG